jgi:hypothetical protein
LRVAHKTHSRATIFFSIFKTYNHCCPAKK